MFVEGDRGALERLRHPAKAADASEGEKCRSTGCPASDGARTLASEGIRKRKQPRCGLGYRSIVAIEAWQRRGRAALVPEGGRAGRMCVWEGGERRCNWIVEWWAALDSNQWPPACKAGALTN